MSIVVRKVICHSYEFYPFILSRPRSQFQRVSLQHKTVVVRTRSPVDNWPRRRHVAYNPLSATLPLTTLFGISAMQNRSTKLDGKLSAAECECFSLG